MNTTTNTTTMKKFGLISMAVLTAVSLTACGSKDGGGSNKLTEVEKTCQTAIADYTATLVASTEGTVVADGDMVTVDYVGRLSDKEVFDTSIEVIAQGCGTYQEGRTYSDGLPFLVGQGQMIPGFEKAVLGMKVGESKTVEILSADAYGERSEDNIVEMPKSELPEGDRKVGDELPTFFGPVLIKEVSEDSIKLDTNHPLAGKDLTFDITVKSVEAAADVALPEVADEEIIAEVVDAVEEVVEVVEEKVEEVTN